MERGLFSFLVVVAFIPAVLYSVNLHSVAVENVASMRVVLIEQQVLTNQEHEFEYTFWESAKKFKLKQWLELMESKGVTVESSALSFVEVSPNGDSVVLKSDCPYESLKASFSVGNSSSFFLIPVGCSSGL